MSRVAVVLVLLLLSGAPWAAEDEIDPWLRSRVADAVKAADGDLDRGLEQLTGLERIWRRNPARRAFIAGTIAALLSQAGRLEEAEAELVGALEGRPPAFAPRLRLSLASVQLMRDETDAARVTLETWRAHVEDPEPQGLFLLGYAYVQAERFGPAVESLEQAVAATSDPRDPWIELLAYAYGRNGQGAKAVALLEGLISKRPTRARWWRQLATVYQLMEEVPRGTAALAVIDQIEGLRFSESRYLARLYAYLGMPYEGGKLLEAALEQNREEAEYRHWMLLAELWIQAREPDRAIPALRHAAEQAKDGEPMFLLGQLYMNWERYDEAVAALNDAIAAYGETVPPNAYYLLAIAAINLERPEEARLALMKIEDEAAFATRVRSLRRNLEQARIRDSR